MLRTFIVSAALACVVSTATVCAQTVHMSGDEIKATFAGGAFDGVYSDNSVWTETYKSDGGISYTDRFGPKVGNWHVEGRDFCTLYHDGGGACWRVERVSDNCFRFYVVDRSSRAHSPVAGATGWQTSRPATCVPPRPVS